MKKFLVALISISFVSAAFADHHNEKTEAQKTEEQTKGFPAKDPKAKKTVKAAGSSTVESPTPAAPAGERDGSGNQPNNAVKKDDKATGKSH